MEDHWTKKRGFVNPSTSEISRSPVSGMSFSDSQRRNLGGLDYLKTYHTTGDGNEIIMKSFGNVTSIDIEENIISKNINLKSEYIITYWNWSSSGFRISVRNSSTLEEISYIIKDQTDFTSSPNSDPSKSAFPGYSNFSNAIWDHKRGCFALAVWYEHRDGDYVTMWARLYFINENGSIKGSDEIFSKEIPFISWMSPQIRVYIGNSLAIVNSSLKERIWVIYNYEGEWFSHVCVVDNGLVSPASNAPKCDAVATNGSYLVVPGDLVDDYKWPYESNWWYWNRVTEVGDGGIYTALLEGDEQIKLYSKSGELIKTLDTIKNNFTDIDHRINYMIGTKLIAVDRRDFNPYYGTDRCQFISLDGNVVKNINDFPGGSGGSGGWQVQSNIGVGERVTISSY